MDEISPAAKRSSRTYVSAPSMFMRRIITSLLGSKPSWERRDLRRQPTYIRGAAPFSKVSRKIEEPRPIERSETLEALLIEEACQGFFHSFRRDGDGSPPPNYHLAP